MPNISEIARDWGVDRSYVSKCVNKRGCPSDSLENARDWRQAHASKRAPTSPRQIARIIAQKKDVHSPEARERRRQYYAAHPPPDDPLRASVDDAREAQQALRRLLAEAMIDQSDSVIAVRIANHTKALEALLEAEKRYREIMQSRSTLIPLDEVKDIARRGYDAIISGLSSLPQKMAARCNSQDPHHAMEILQSECTAILIDAKKIYASWFSA